MTLTGFLLARIAEDEEGAYELHADACDRRFPCECGYPTRVLDDCAAERRIVELCAQYEGRPEDTTDPGFNGGATFVGTNVLRALASVYADHTDYREEWVL